MTERHDKNLGRIAFVCAVCERNRAGLCRDCPSPKAGPRAMRCDPCRKKQSQTLDRAAQQRLRDENSERYQRDKAQRRKRYKKDPALRQRIRAASQARRKAKPHVRTDIDRAYDRAKAAEYWRSRPRRRKRSAAWQRNKYHTDPVYRERVLERSRKRTERRRRERALAVTHQTGCAA